MTLLELATGARELRRQAPRPVKPPALTEMDLLCRLADAYESGRFKWRRFDLGNYRTYGCVSGGIYWMATEMGEPQLLRPAQARLARVIGHETGREQHIFDWNDRLPLFRGVPNLVRVLRLAGDCAH